MTLLRLTSFALVILAMGCDQSPEIPNVAKQNYPAVIRDSSERRAKAEREWRRMLDAYGAPQTPPDLYPVTYTPRSLLGVSGGIKVMAVKPEPGSEAAALRTAVKQFIDRWRELIGADPTMLSLAAADGSGAVHRLTYRQANYPFPVARNYGEMTVVINNEGQLLQLDDRFLPVVELPLRPSVEREVAAKRVLGRSFTYTDIAGREQREQISNPAEVSVKRIVVVPIERGDAIEVHLAWEIVAGKALSWTVYIDAISGEELRVEQNFST